MSKCPHNGTRLSWDNYSEKNYVDILDQLRYRALVYAWFKYARLPEMAGVGLQKQTFVAAGKGVHL